VAALAVLVVFALGYAYYNAPKTPTVIDRVQALVDQACTSNHDVVSDPGQVNTACAKATRRMMVVFALFGSGGNAKFRNISTGQVGLEPMNRPDGGVVAWALNLHQAYDPNKPIQSIQVAARTINQIVGGGSLVTPNGRDQRSPGLESSSANCLRYTGSKLVRSKGPGWPKVCVGNVRTPKQWAAFVRDVYVRWVYAASGRKITLKPLSQEVQNVVYLYENTNPGDPRVQQIIRDELIAHGFPGSSPTIGSSSSPTPTPGRGHRSALGGDQGRFAAALGSAPEIIASLCIFAAPRPCVTL
jgi:hypothetical protein